MGQSIAVTDHARSTLFSEATGIAPGGTVRVALYQALEPGWHVYWKNPGDSGLPLETLWSLPPGALASPTDYPVPERIQIGPLVNYGHEGTPTFVTTITAPPYVEVGSSIDIGLEATWLICAEICVPETGEFLISLPVVAQPSADSAAQEVFADADANFPRAANAVFRAVGGALALEAEGIGRDAIAAYFFPETDSLVAPTAAQKFERRDAVVRLTMPTLKDIAAPLKGVVVVESSDGRRGYAIDANADSGLASPSVSAGPATVRSPATTANLPSLLFAALMGGAILNLMPCVFPILFVKAASFASAGADNRLMRRQGLFYGAGVVATFAALGAALLMLRAAGEGLGWGFHLQSPAVVALSAYVLFIVGLNFSGAFSIGASLQNIGADAVASAKGDVAAFLTGVLAVFVAAPCVGPFLTAPIGAAAVLSPAAGMAIFVVMALGLALPYVALSFSPGLAKRLPRPGPWMERFRQILAFPVFAAAAYFLWVLSAQTGSAGLALALGGFILIGLATRLWEWGRGTGWAQPAAIAATLAAFVLIGLLRPAPAIAAQTGYSYPKTIEFDVDEIERRRAEGEAIFIDFTAAWCVTCQVNKFTVLSSKKVTRAFDAAGVTVAIADWTNRDDAIADALAGFGANGVPLYVFYPKGGDAVVLPQPLTEASILSLLSTQKDGDPL
ncbi:MAG: protein-disulfide reductase DsbD family protein [Parvularculaceae bacterium]|nr:protein-disulfide reductase DsbD family protein [Parvularculaceae bacterium]